MKIKAADWTDKATMEKMTEDFLKDIIAKGGKAVNKSKRNQRRKRRSVVRCYIRRANASLQDEKDISFSLGHQVLYINWLQEESKVNSLFTMSLFGGALEYSRTQKPP